MFRAVDPNTKEEFAVKYFLPGIENISGSTHRRAVQGEIAALEKLEKHKNILNYQEWGTVDKTDRFFIVSEWLKLGSLADYIEKVMKNKYFTLLKFMMLMTTKLTKF